MLCLTLRFNVTSIAVLAVLAILPPESVLRMVGINLERDHRKSRHTSLSAESEDCRVESMVENRRTRNGGRTRIQYQVQYRALAGWEESLQGHQLTSPFLLHGLVRT